MPNMPIRRGYCNEGDNKFSWNDESGKGWVEIVEI